MGGLLSVVGPTHAGVGGARISSTRAGELVDTPDLNRTVQQGARTIFDTESRGGGTGGNTAMASQSCWKCLLRPSTGTPSLSSMRSLAPMATIISATTNPTSTAPSTTHPFSTSAPSRAAAGAYRTVKPKPGVHQRLGKRMSLVKKKKEVVRYKRPAQGERRAYRKRIVLSNNNAIPVRGLETMTTTNLVDPESAGKMLKIPDSLIDRLRTSEAFKSSQTWRLFHSPHMLVRSETVRLCRRMMESAGEGRTARVVIAGERAAGKSMLLLQATINAFLNKWVVINIPEGTSFVSSSSRVQRR